MQHDCCCLYCNYDWGNISAVGLNIIHILPSEISEAFLQQISFICSDSQEEEVVNDGAMMLPLSHLTFNFIECATELGDGFNWFAFQELQEPIAEQLQVFYLQHWKKSDVILLGRACAVQGGGKYFHFKEDAFADI